MFGITNDNSERGQVGIGTLIVFIAMVLVAAIAAGVLINTAGFLQSQSQQTGEESSAQVTNQLSLVSTTGIVSGGEGSSADVVTLDGNVSVDSGQTVEVGIRGTAGSSVDDQVNISATDSNGEISLRAGQSLELVHGSGDTVTLTNADTGSSIEFDAGNENVTVSDSGIGEGFQLNYTFTDAVSGETTIRTANITADGTADNLLVDAETRTEQFIQFSGTKSSNDDTLIISDGEEVTVQDGAGILANADGQSLGVSDDDTLVFDTTGEEEFTVTNTDTGSSITVGAEGAFGAGGSNTVALSADGDTAAVDSNDAFLATNDVRYLFQRGLADGNAVTEIQMLVASSPGASDIDMTQTVITLTSPAGQFQLNHGSTPIENEQFSLQAVQDTDDTIPVLSSGDRFEIIVDPGRLEPGSDTLVELTTPSGATKSAQIRVPDSLANEEAVSL
jgi:flagellin-like protein